MIDSVFAVRPNDGDALPMGALPYGFSSDDDQLLMVMAGAARFGEATFEHAIRQLSAGGSLASAFVLPSDRFAAAAARLPAGDATFLYHVGRCGSTLLARMLAVDPTLCVFSEPAAWAQLQQRGASRPAETPSAAAAADGCLRLFSRFAADRGQHLVVKPSSWQVLHARAIRAVCASTRDVFVFRSPSAVVASNLAVPPGFGAIIHDDLEGPASVLDGWLPGVEPERLAEPVGMYAELWRVAVDAVLDAPDGVLLVSYDELMTEPDVALTRVVRHLGLPRFPLEQAVRQGDFYSKSARRTERFDPAGAHQRKTLSASEQDRVAGITDDAERRLLIAWEAQRLAEA